jgi:hypothetical protein
MYVLQGFDALRRKNKIQLIFESYEEFERRGAPPVVEGNYQSHKNIIVFDVCFGGRWLHGVYDANDIYYKIPNSLLRWCDLYFKSNYQQTYLETGELLKTNYWDKLPFFDNLVPEPLDISNSRKFRKANFTMNLFHTDFIRNRLYLHIMNGLWHNSSVDRKKWDCFFIGRYWGETKASTLAILDTINKKGSTFVGGVVEENELVPDSHRRYIHRPYSLSKWCRTAASARISIVTRGLQGCVGFKPLHLLMVGAPFIANQLMSNLWQPLVDGINYIAVKDDFSDLPEKLEMCTTEKLVEMGKANREHWNRYVSPESNAKYILSELAMI